MFDMKSYSAKQGKLQVPLHVCMCAMRNILNMHSALPELGSRKCMRNIGFRD